MVKKIETVQKKFKKPVIFPEAGYPSLEAPHREPWDETKRKISLQDQVRCYEALLRAFYNKRWFYGVDWWKIGNNGFGGPQDGSHTPWDKPAMDGNREMVQVDQATRTSRTSMTLVFVGPVFMRSPSGSKNA